MLLSLSEVCWICSFGVSLWASGKVSGVCRCRLARLSEGMWVEWGDGEVQRLLLDHIPMRMLWMI